MIRIIKSYSELDVSQWERLLLCSPTASWFQSPSAFYFFQESHAALIPFVVGVSENGLLKGVAVGYTTRERSKLRQFFTARSIVNGGPLLARDISRDALTALLNALTNAQKRSIYVEIRNYHDFSFWQNAFKKSTFDYCEHLNFRIQTTSLRAAQQAISDGRKRDIRKSLENGAKILEKPSIEQVKEFYRILQRLYSNKIRKPLFAWDFFERLYREPTAHFLLVEYEAAIVGGLLCVGLPNQALYEWYVCGEDTRFGKIAPSALATYAGIAFACQNAFAYFDMMGAGEPNKPYGVRDFKARFGGELVQHGRFIFIRHKLRYLLGKIAIKFIKMR